MRGQARQSPVLVQRAVSEDPRWTRALGDHLARPQRGRIEERYTRRPQGDQHGCHSWGSETSKFGRVNEMEGARSMRAVVRQLRRPRFKECGRGQTTVGQSPLRTNEGARVFPKDY